MSSQRLRILSVNVGRPRQVDHPTKAITTAIWKEPVRGRVAVRKHNLEGDEQADLKVHGGPSKAVYAYPAEHYPYWRELVPDMEIPWAMFGENLTTEGLMEESVCIGDRFRIGTSELMVTEPRLPCYKLALRFGRDDVIQAFVESRRTGWYFAVVEEGELGAGDELQKVHEDPARVPVADIARLFLADKEDVEGMQKAMTAEALPGFWKHTFQKRIGKLTG